jgi:MFS family permease
MPVVASENTSGSADRNASTPHGSPSSPLRIAAFRNLWLANLVSNLGTWMHDVGAGWLMTTLAPDPFMVSLVQVAVVLPGFIFTLPAGALADIVDRRRYMLAAILWMTAMAGTIGLLTISHAITPWALIALTFGLGAGLAMMLPAFASMVPDLVPRHELTAAVTLNSLSMNLTRAVGPAIAGALIALAGPGPVFLLNAASFAGIFFVIFRYRSTQPRSTLPSERFFGALQAGFRFVRQSPPMQAVLIRALAFFSMMSGVFAFLPLIVRAEVGAGPQTYGLLVTSMGAGAVAVGLSLAKLRARVSSDAIVAGGTALGALALIGLATIRAAAPLALIMFAAGAAWISVISTLQVTAQLALPAWVRARGLAVYIATFMGSMAVGSASWGRIASATGTRDALLIAAAFGLAAGLLAARWRLAGHALADRSIAEPLPEPTLSIPLEPHEGPVMVNIEYLVDPGERPQFEAAMADVRRMRLRHGAIAWGLFQDATEERRFVETFIDPTWLEHLRRHERFTMEDLELKRVAESFHRGERPPRTTHFIARGAPRRRSFLKGNLSKSPPAQ